MLYNLRGRSLLTGPLPVLMKKLLPVTGLGKTVIPPEDASSISMIVALAVGSADDLVLTAAEVGECPLLAGAVVGRPLLYVGAVGCPVICHIQRFVAVSG